MSEVFETVFCGNTRVFSRLCTVLTRLSSAYSSNESIYPRCWQKLPDSLIKLKRIMLHIRFILSTMMIHYWPILTLKSESSLDLFCQAAEMKKKKTEGSIWGNRWQESWVLCSAFLCCTLFHLNCTRLSEVSE